MWFLSKGDSMFGTYHFQENNSNIIFEKIKAMDFNKYSIHNGFGPLQILFMKYDTL